MSARILAVSLVAGCGRLAGGDYLGEPLYALTGNVIDDGSSQSLVGVDLRVALFWANDGSRGEEQAVVVTTRFPAEYTLELYLYPPDDARFDAPWGSRYAIGALLVYADRNGDQHWSEETEELVGGSLDQMVLFAESASGGVVGPDGTVASVVNGFSRVYSEATTPLCGSTDTARFSRPPATVSTDLSVGVEWWTSLVDVDCDGQTDEWDGACPQGEELERWCAEGAEPGTPCAEACFGDPSDPDGNVDDEEVSR